MIMLNLLLLRTTMGKGKLTTSFGHAKVQNENEMSKIAQEFLDGEWKIINLIAGQL